MTNERMATKEAGMIYVYPCPKCGENVGSEINEPVECDDCDPHEYVDAYLLSDPSIRFCLICDYEEEGHN